MAFASVRDSASSAVAGQAGVTVPMPALITAGDLLLLWIRANASAQINVNPTGFTLLDDHLINAEVSYLYAKVAAGGDTATFDANSVNGWGMVCASIQDWEGTLAGVETAVITASADPPSVIPSWGSDDNLFIECAGARTGTLPTVSAWSTGYTEVNQVTGDFGTDVVSGMAYKQAAAGSDNPDAVTFSGSPSNPTTVTAVVRPAAVDFPAAPTNLTATAVSNTQINLAWDAVTGANGYDIERDSVVIVSDQAATTYNDTGLTGNTEYSYRVRAVS